MKNVTKQMLKVYKPVSDLDWMNYRLVKKDLTFHHIIKKEHGGKEEISNGALLMPVAHQYLHLIECRDIDTYKMINKMFEIINRQGYEPNKEQRLIIEQLLRDFESIHRWDKNSKGKILVKYPYLKRELNL